MNKDVQDLKMKIESLKKIQTEGIVEMKNIGIQIGTTEASFTSRIQEVEEKISGIDDIIELDTSVKEKCLI